MNIVLRLAWRNLWRHSRRTWLTIGAMVFSNILLVFMISLQFGVYGLMINNTLQVFTGHMQIQAPGYKDDQKMRQTVPSVADLAGELRERTGLDSIAARAGSWFARMLGRDTVRKLADSARALKDEYDELVDAIQSAPGNGVSYIIINPAAFTHTSVALRDALLATAIPFIEVHLSNVHAREAFRSQSYFSDVAEGVISGLGALGYELAMQAALRRLAENK